MLELLGKCVVDSLVIQIKKKKGGVEELKFWQHLPKVIFLAKSNGYATFVEEV